MVVIVSTVYSPNLLPFPGYSQGTLRSTSQDTTCSTTNDGSFILSLSCFIAKHQAGKLWLPIFLVFGLSKRDSNPNLPSTRPLI